MPPLPPLPSAQRQIDLPSSAGSAVAARAVAADALPDEDRLRPIERWERIVKVAELLADSDRARNGLAATFGYPIEAWDQFCRDVPVGAPPPGPSLPMTVVVDATAAAPFLLRATLRALQDQSLQDWTAQVVAPDDLRDGPVGAFATTDARITFVDRGTPASDRPVVLLDAGTALDPQALAWLGFALARTRADAAFADHDHGIADPGLRLLRADPILFGAFDPATVAAIGPPAVVALRNWDGGTDRGAALMAASRTAGVPRVLATRLALPLVARKGQVSADDDVPGRLAPIPFRPASTSTVTPRDDRIAVVIPTRDGAALLSRAIETLRMRARNPARLDIVVIDNRSEHDETRALFARLSADKAARVVPLDGPFNWSLASNTGAAASDAPLVVFANNDIEMLSAGWDDALAQTLADPSIGAVGARLIYPGRTVQHAGVAFGFGPGGAEHEGRGVPASEAGPYRRYVTPHAVSSVTGAFLGVRRANFDTVGGFDAERLMIAHSDVDLCLKLRELGLSVRYVPAIEAIHHEGASRGTNQTRAAIAWDEGERADLIDRWGDALFEDVGISPYWQRGGQPFEALREPSLRTILAHLDRTALAQPWRPTRRAAQRIRDR